MRKHMITDRQREVISRVADGKTNEQIARELFVCRDTVVRAVQQLCVKLGARNRVHAVYLALRAGVIR